MSEYKDNLAKAGDTPDVTELTREFRRSISDGYSLNRLADNDEIRYAKWSGQSTDGKKYSSNMNEGSKAFPFEGAHDSRVFHVDEVINTQCDILMSSLKRATLKISGVELNDSPVASNAMTLMSWAKNNALHNELNREAEHLAQWGQQYGISVLFISWEQKDGLKPVKVTFDELLQMAANIPEDNIMSEFPALIENPDSEDQAVDIMVGMVDVGRVKARRMVKELRNKGETTLPIPYQACNKPNIQALKILEDVCFPPETCGNDLQNARVIFRRQLMTEVEVRSKIKTEGWDPQFVEEILATTGKSNSYESFESSISSFSVNNGIHDRSNLIEVVYAYTRALDTNGIPGIYCTVISPYVDSSNRHEPLFGKHFLVDYAHGQMPFVVYRRENVRRKISESRGVAEISESAQRELKAQIDSIYDHTSFSTLPSLLVNARVANRFGQVGPGSTITVNRMDDVKWLDAPPKDPNTAFTFIELVKREQDRYYGFPNAGNSMEAATAKQQRSVNNWLGCWAEVYRQIYHLCIQYMAPEEMMRITGTEIPIVDEMMSYDFILRFDVAESMNPELVEKRLQTIANFLVPQDVGGVLSRDKLIEFQTRLVAPEMADDLIVPRQQATEKIRQEVKQDVSMMMNGIEPGFLTEAADPTAGMRMQFLQELTESNPKIQEKLGSGEGGEGGDELFSAMYQAYAQNLQFQIQQQQNKTIGRTGVEPVTGQAGY